MGAKFPRCLVSEIVAVDVPVEDGAPDPRTGEVEVRTSGRRTGSRIDPLGVLRRVEVFKGQDGWDVVKERAGKGACTDYLDRAPASSGPATRLARALDLHRKPRRRKPAAG